MRTWIILGFLIASQLPPLLAEEKKWPGTFTVTCGLINVCFDAKVAYNLNGIVYNAKRLGMSGGGFYGTVFYFPGQKFIGSGHTEHETEKVEKLELIADGHQIDPRTIKTGSDIKAKHFTLIKTAKVKTFILRCATVITPEFLYQRSDISASANTQLNLFYNFMMPWTPQMSDYIAKTHAGEELQGEFISDNKFLINRNVKWVALYSKELRTGIVSIPDECSQDFPNSVMLWDRPAYHKFYLRSIINKTYPAGLNTIYNLQTGFFESDAVDWPSSARAIIHTMEKHKAAERNTQM